MKIIPYILILFISFSCVSNVFAHKRAKFNIVVDTDGGADDLRSLTYIMASRDFNINAITTVEGVLTPDVSTQFVKQLCNAFHHEGIPVGIGDVESKRAKSSVHDLNIWKQIFEINSGFNFENSVDILEMAISSESRRTTIIAMGPLTNIAKLVNKHPELIPKIETVIWYSDFNTKPDGYRYNYDKGAFNDLMNKQIPVKMISAQGTTYWNSFLTSCSSIKSVYAQAIFKAFVETESKDSIMYYYDDLLPFYLLYPSMFEEESVLEYATLVKPSLRNNIFDVLASSVLNSDKPDQGVIYNELPTGGFYLRSDLGNFTDTIIKTHGYTEFKLTSLTSEIHSHLGVYSILGAKTGLRIMEYLHAGLDEIEIVSYAGYNPPISCFNDGLQVGTGATIGYGAISVDTTKAIEPAVLVKYNGREILFSIKPEVINEIKFDISGLVKTYGLDSEMYWIKLREISIKKYWLGMSRYDILDVEEL